MPSLDFRKLSVTQESVVFVLAAVLFVIFSLTLHNFLTPGNLIALVRSVSILGILGLGMGLVVIGRGIDLAMVATMVVAVSWVLSTRDASTRAARLGLAASARVLGPRGTGQRRSHRLCGGAGNFHDPRDGPGHLRRRPGVAVRGRCPEHSEQLGVLPIPGRREALRTALAHRRLRLVRFDPLGASCGGRASDVTSTPAGTIRPPRATPAFPLRPLIVSQYVITALIAYAAGLVMAATSAGMSTRVYNSTMIYDVLLVVVLGGIGLSGGRGGVRNVLVGTLLIGVLLDGMTILNIPYVEQNLIKSRDPAWPPSSSTVS